MFRQILNVIVATGAGGLIFLAFRRLWRQSSVIGLIVAGGILARAVLGLVLFWVSYLGLPALHSLQLGEGFWTVAPDARAYFRYAAAGVDLGLWGMYPGDSSPFFVKTLALWMSGVGVSPAAGLFLNLSIYLALCTLIVRLYQPRNDWRADLPCIASVAAFSFSPVLLIHGTQPMKEDLFGLLIALICLGMLRLTRVMVFGEPEGSVRAVLAGAVLLLFAANYCIAGIRPYYAVIVWLAVAFALAAFAFTARTRRIPYFVNSLVVLSVIWVAYWQGAGPGYWGPTFSSAPSLNHAVAGLEQVRKGFIQTGGSTNMVALDALAADASAAGTPAQPIVGAVAHLKAAAKGLAAEFVPISVLKAASIISFPGGRGLLPIADLDTVFLDVSVLVSLGFLYKRRAAVGHRLPFVISVLCLSLLSAGLLAYVVTNFGTLFRIKSMIAVPLWLLCLAVAPNRRP